MKLSIDLDNEFVTEATIAEALKEAIQFEIGKEVRKVVKTAVEDNRTAIVALANAYAKRLVAEAEKALTAK